MAEFTLYFAQTASCVVTVEADDLESAIDAAYDKTPGGLCAQCAGWGNPPGIDLSGEWELDEEAVRTDYPDGA
jgi:hypothetical protein